MFSVSQNININDSQNCTSLEMLFLTQNMSKYQVVGVPVLYLIAVEIGSLLCGYAFRFFFISFYPQGEILKYLSSSRILLKVIFFKCLSVRIQVAFCEYCLKEMPCDLKICFHLRLPRHLILADSTSLSRTHSGFRVRLPCITALASMFFGDLGSGWCSLIIQQSAGFSLFP